MPVYPSMKAGKLLALLEGKLGYRIIRQSGSHKTLRANERPDLTFAFHDGQEIAPGLVRKILEKDVGLSPACVAELLDLKG